MRATLPVTAMLLLAACANGGGLGQRDGQPTVDAATAALRDGSPQAALRIDDAILAKDPRNVAALLNRGDAQAALQRSGPAAESYTDALRADPGSVVARIGLGRLRLAASPGAAESLFLEASQRDPRNAVAWNDLGIARDLLGRHQEAQAAYRQAVDLDASMTGAQVNLAMSLAMTGRADGAAPPSRPLASASTAPRAPGHDLAAVSAMGGARSEGQRSLARDLPPDQVGQRLSIFIAASPLSDPTHSAGAPPRPSAAQAGRPLSGKLASAGPTRAQPASGGPRVQLSTVTPNAEPAAERKRMPKQAGKLPSASRPMTTARSGARAASPVAPRAATQPRIALSATADTWMRVRDKSGHMLPNRTQHPGESRPVARSNMGLGTGNASGTDTLVAAAAIPSLGALGTVRRDVPLDAGLLAAWKLPPASLSPASLPPASLTLTTARSGASSASQVALPIAPSTASPSAAAASATSGSTPPAATAVAALDATLTLPHATDTAAPAKPMASAPPSAAAVLPAPAVIRPRIAPGATADALHPGEHGDLAAALSPGTRALTVGVDGITGAAGLIWPGDRLDLILTQEMSDAAAAPGHRVVAETVLSDLRVIAIDQQLVQGATPGSPAAPARTVTLEVNRDQAERVSVAMRLGRVSLAVRSADTANQPADPLPAATTVWAGDVSAALSHDVATNANHAVRVFPGAADSKEFRF